MKHKKIVFIILAIVSIGICGAVSAYTLLFNRPLNITEPTFLYIDENDNIDSVYTKLEKKFHASSLFGFRILTHYSKYHKNIHTGAYLFSDNERTWDIFHRLRTGHQTPVTLTIPSVRTVGQLLKTVSRQLMLDSASIAKLLNDSAYCSNLGYNHYTIPALFIPNTYEVYWNISPQSFIARMQKEHNRFWNNSRKTKARQLGLTPIEVSTLASIVDEETANDSEKPIIAGLYLNRLRIDMPLQADPTIKFGLQQFGLQRILHKHLNIDTPYNTYKHTGLPPGPIRIPSIKGMESVLNYTQHSYLYMCAKEDLSGTHNFSSTLREHQNNAHRYQNALNKLKIK